MSNPFSRRGYRVLDTNKKNVKTNLFVICHNFSFFLLNTSPLFFFLGVFLIPYFIILVLCGVPMLFMELAVGQYTGRGPIGAIGQLCPLFKG